MDAELFFDDSKIRKQLNENEYILWKGQPGKGISLHFLDIYILLLGMVFTGFSFALWYSCYLENFSDSIYLVFAVLLTVVSGYFVCIRFFVEKWKRANIFYVLTNQRLFISLKSKLNVIPNRAITNAKIRNHKNGNITVYFDEYAPQQRDDRVAGMSFDCFSLLNVRNGQQIIEMMKGNHIPVYNGNQTSHNTPSYSQETILWKGSPAKGNLFYCEEFITSIFGVFWSSALGYLTLNRIGFAGIVDSLPFSLIPLFMFCVGLYLVFIRFIYEAYRKTKLTYTITNKRLIISDGKREKTYLKHELCCRKVHYYPNRNALITIDSTSAIRINGSYIRSYQAGMSSYCSALVNVENPEKIISLLNQMDDENDNSMKTLKAEATIVSSLNTPSFNDVKVTLDEKEKPQEVQDIVIPENKSGTKMIQMIFITFGIIVLFASIFIAFQSANNDNLEETKAELNMVVAYQNLIDTCSRYDIDLDQESRNNVEMRFSVTHDLLQGHVVIVNQNYTDEDEGVLEVRIDCRAKLDEESQIDLLRFYKLVNCLFEKDMMMEDVKQLFDSVNRNGEISKECILKSMKDARLQYEIVKLDDSLYEILTFHGYTENKVRYSGFDE